MMELAGDEVHLWWLDLEAHHHDDDRLLLDADERQRADRFRFGHHRRHFTTHRAWLRRVLALYLHCAPAGIRYGRVGNDKPVLATDSAHGELHFNLSHSAHVALCAVTRDAPLGVDVERRRVLKDELEIAARHFGPREFAWVREADATQRLERFFTVWTRKEAFIKATGEGLSRALESFDVRPQERGPVAVRECTPAAAPWYVQALSLDADVAAALCSRCPQPRLSWPAPPPGRDRALRPATP